MRVQSPSSQHTFSQVPRADIPRSSFDRDSDYKTTFDGGYLIPVFVDEVLPGDTHNLRMTAFARLSTPIRPFMDNLFMDSFFFFVPCRLVWSNWEKFNGEQNNPGDSTSYVMPTMTSTAVTGYANQSLHDYLRIPTLIPGLQHISLVHRAYNLIWNEWFRDQNLQNSVPVPTGDGPDTPTDFVLLRRGKRHDYFTSALPWPQKGPAVNLPLGSTAPVITNNQPPKFQAPGGGDRFMTQTSGSLTNAWSSGASATGSVRFGAESGLVADLATASAATINSIRQAFQIQKLYERDARGGTRYTEIIRSHFGVISPDARLQRPEYLGGGSSPININPIAQTSAVPSQPTPQGNLAAMGTAVLNNHGFTKSFTEHGYIIGLVSVRASLSYQQGLPRMYSRSTRWDFYWPALAHIGEQTILNKEIYAQGTANPTADAAVFGYQERFAEYRYMPSAITGKFRSNDPQTLDTWHLAQKFTSLPALSATFIEDNPPIGRVVAVPSEPNILFDAYYKLKSARPMPIYSVPGLIDHF